VCGDPAGSVVGAGAGCKQVAAGDTILYSKFGLGSTMLQFQDEEHLLLKEEDVVGVLPSGGDIPDLKPVGDRVLVQVRATPYPFPASPPRVLTSRGLSGRLRALASCDAAEVRRERLCAKTDGSCHVVGAFLPTFQHHFGSKRRPASHSRRQSVY
jgi:hypothetical protein